MHGDVMLTGASTKIMDMYASAIEHTLAALPPGHLFLKRAVVSYHVPWDFVTRWYLLQTPMLWLKSFESTIFLRRTST